MANYRHSGDRAVVFFNDDLAWDVAVDLVDTVDLLVRGYFYAVMEIQIASNGGSTDALDYFLAAQQRWRSGGVRIVTRVLSRVPRAPPH